jgi:Co/Zn/Cd efflux system component
MASGGKSSLGVLLGVLGTVLALAAGIAAYFEILPRLRHPPVRSNGPMLVPAPALGGFP